ncbi:MAG: hypothetical protein ACKOQ8_05545 [Micrococcales bacterium]
MKFLKREKIVIDRNPDLIEMTLRQFFKITLINRFILKKQGRYALERGKVVEMQEPKVYNLAVVLDEHVHEVLRVNDKLADILLAQPKFVEFTSQDHVHPGRTDYVDGQFFTASPEVGETVGHAEPEHRASY